MLRLSPQLRTPVLLLGCLTLFSLQAYSLGVVGLGGDWVLEKQGGQKSTEPTWDIQPYLWGRLAEKYWMKFGYTSQFYKSDSLAGTSKSNRLEEKTWFLSLLFSMLGDGKGSPFLSASYYSNQLQSDYKQDIDFSRWSLGAGYTLALSPSFMLSAEGAWRYTPGYDNHINGLRESGSAVTLSLGLLGAFF